MDLRLRSTASGRALSLGTVSAVLVIAVGCSSSSNNTNSNNVATVAQRNPTIASAVLTPSPTVAIVRTVTPGRPPLASSTAVAGLRPATPLASPSTGGLQQQLAAAALKQSDLPSGYSSLVAPDTSTPLANETAGYQQLFTKLALPDVAAVVDGLQGFRDTAAAQAAFKDLQNQLQTADQSFGLKLTPITSSTTIGDETQTYQATLSVQSYSLSGYLVAWRRGRLSGTIIMAGTGGTAPSTPADAVALAQQQDTSLKNITQ